jgi:hypothetical protein
MALRWNRSGIRKLLILSGLAGGIEAFYLRQFPVALVQSLILFLFCVRFP